MALDEPDADDVTETVNGLPFCMKKDFFEAIGTVSIRCGFFGFVIDSEFPYEEDLNPKVGACSCSSGGHGGSCAL